MADKILVTNGADFNNEQLKNLADGSLGTDGVNLNQLNAAIAGGVKFIGPYDANTNTPDLVTPAPGAVSKGYLYVTSVAGTFFGENLEIGDTLIAMVDDPSSLSDWIVVQDNIDPGLFLLKDIASYTEQEPVLDADFHLTNRGGIWYKTQQEDVNTRDRAEAIEGNNALSTTFVGNNNPTNLLWDGAGGGIFLHNFTYSKAGNTGEFTYTNSKAVVTKEKRFLMIAKIAFAPSSGSSKFNFYMSINGSINASSRSPMESKGANDIHEVVIVKNTALKDTDQRGLMVEKTQGSGSLRVESINWVLIPIGNQNG